MPAWTVESDRGEAGLTLTLVSPSSHRDDEAKLIGAGISGLAG